MDPRLQKLPLALWELLALASLCLFFALIGLVGFSLLERRRRTTAVGLALLPLSFLLLQGFLGLEPMRSPRGPVHAALHDFFLELPPWVLIPVLLGLAALALLLWIRLLRFRRSHVTPMSVKEAVDVLPLGICCFRPWGRIVLMNTAMEALCRRAVGRVLINGEDLRLALERGALLPGCSCEDVNGEKLLLLPDGSVWRVSRHSFDWEGAPLTALTAADVTEAYRKTRAMEQKNRELVALNQRLAKRNREIVDLTIQNEILAARARLHDALGEDLLHMKQLLQNGGSREETEALRDRLRRNVGFLREEAGAETPDEYEVLLRTAERLGVRVEIRGALPRTEPLCRIVSTGMHECLTNLLRHAHGDRLCVELREEGRRLTVRYSGNGLPPRGPVRETGGLRILRRLAEQAAGTMRVAAEPVFSVTLELPIPLRASGRHDAGNEGGTTCPTEF